MNKAPLIDSVKVQYLVEKKRLIVVFFVKIKLLVLKLN